jgi:hypothetical protein
MVMDGTLRQLGWDLTVGGDLTVNGDHDLDDGTCEVGGGLHVAGTMDADGGGVIEVHGPITGSSGAVLNMGTGSLIVNDDVDFTHFSDVSWKLGGSIRGEASESYEVDFDAHIELADAFVYHASDSVKVTLKSATDSVHVKGDLHVFRGTVLTDIEVTVDGDADLDVDGSIKGTYRDAKIDITGSITLRKPRFVYKKGRITATLDGGSVEIDAKLEVRGDSAYVYVNPGDTIRVHPGGTFNVFADSANTRAGLALDGAPGSGQWHLELGPGSIHKFTNVRVRDSDASPGETATATGNSIDDGNNVNWNFDLTGAEDTPPVRLTVRAVPNPFNPHTTIHYTVPRIGPVTIRIYDVAGRLVRTVLSEVRRAGPHAVPWDGRDHAGGRVGSGVYFCRVESGGESVVHKLVLLR